MSERKYEPRKAQPGVSVRPREHLVLAALKFAATDPASNHAAAEALRELVRAELAGHPANPDIETGELGYEAHHGVYDLLVTVGLSTSGYDNLGAAATDRPIDLHPMPADVRNPTNPGADSVIPGEGDVLVHIASNDLFVAEHVLRRIEHELSQQFSVVWVQTGAQRYNTHQKGSRSDSRALIGFLDGTANLSMGNPDDRALVFIDHQRPRYPPNPQPEQYSGAQFPDLRPVPTGPEPTSLDAGTYLDVEVLLQHSAFFDAQAVPQQEQLVGRTKVDGTPVAGAAPSSHVQKANPHRPNTDDEQRRFLRRGYSIVRTGGSAIDLGLIFLGYGRSLTAQMEFVRRAWINNPNFPTVGAQQDQLLFGGSVEPQLLVGGYYFIPPLAKANDRCSWVLPTPVAAGT